MANQPAFIPSVWAASNTTTLAIPATTSETGKASWEQGFPVETSLPLTSGGIPPKYGDFNGVLKALSEFAVYAQSGGQYSYSSTLDYSVGSIVVGTDGYIYRAAQTNGPSSTVKNPVGDTSGTWEKIVSQSDLSAITSSLGAVTSTANDAYANASAANAAVTTLDANVVKLSGNQTVGGVKTFASGVTISGGVVLQDTLTATIKTLTNSGRIVVCASTDGGGNNGAKLYLNGATYSNSGNFTLQAGNSSGNKQLVGKPDGTLTWDSKGFVYDSGGQDIAGVKYFTQNFYQKNNSFDITVTPSTAQYNGIGFSDKNDVTFAGITTYQNTNDTRGMMFRIRAKNESSVTTVLQGAKDSSGNITVVCNGTTRPSATNSITLGDATYRWKQLYANTSTINTSDERLKDNITAVPDAVLDAWGDVNWSQFQMCDAIAEKGEDKARLHNGLIAQRIDAVFKAHGLDASRYGLFCWDSWEAVPEEKDENGNVIQAAVEAGDAYSLRYEEALCMEAAYQRRRADRAEARITSLERRLGELEAVLATLIAPISEEPTTEPEEPVVEDVSAQEGEGADA